METNEHILKLSGKVSMPVELELGKAYKILVDGEVIKTERLNNQNGTADTVATFKPIVAQVEMEHGEIVKSKDNRNNSRLMRNACWAVWNKENLPGESETFYDFATKHFLGQLDSIAAEYTKHKS
jgi:hypothetical protein